ncbi:MAG: CDF family Co(II)/Ni(II) efflux transporter DmeF [Stellaceae bacterium]
MDEPGAEPLLHEHVFLGVHHDRNARKTRAVTWLCAATMAAEIAGGAWFNSLAVMADGVHMGTHVAALAIAAFAYSYASRHVRDPNFAFGTGKVGDLAAFASAIALALVALVVAGESVDHLLRPQSIEFRLAILLAALGLAVNIVSARMLREDHSHRHVHDHDPDHDHGHGAAHRHGHDHRDPNLRAAYIHIMADAAVSVLALIGLATGLLLGWIWMDAAMGLVGAAVIANWSWGLVRASGSVLLDRRPNLNLEAEMRSRLEQGGERVVDLHVWRVGPGHVAAAVTLVCAQPQPPDYYKRRLAGLDQLSHVTIEVAPA